MSKVLMIKNANFASNRLCQVTITNPIACTGIQINSYKQMVFYGHDVVFSAVKSPSGSTGDVVWTSSNSSIATVSNGTVHCVASGSATITATCNGHSASVTVTFVKFDIVQGKMFYNNAVSANTKRATTNPVLIKVNAGDTIKAKSSASFETDIEFWIDGSSQLGNKTYTTDQIPSGLNLTKNSNQWYAIKDENDHSYTVTTAGYISILMMTNTSPTQVISSDLYADIGSKFDLWIE